MESKSIWELRRETGKPVPIKSMSVEGPSHEECERALDRALRPVKIPLLTKIARAFNKRNREKTRE